MEHTLTWFPAPAVESSPPKSEGDKHLQDVNVEVFPIHPRFKVMIHWPRQHNTKTDGCHTHTHTHSQYAEHVGPWLRLFVHVVMIHRFSEHCQQLLMICIHCKALVLKLCSSEFLATLASFFLAPFCLPLCLINSYYAKQSKIRVYL